MSQARSRTAILGFLAAAAAGIRLDRPNLTAWFQDQGLGIGDRGLRDALALRVRRRDDDLAHWNPDERDWVRHGLDFDATKLDLDFAVVVFPGADRPEALMEVLRGTERVVRYYEGYDRDVVALLVYDGARERNRLQALLEEHEPRMRWIVVRSVDDAPAARTWLSLARRVAREEHLLVS